MTTTCFNVVRGKRLRATRMDECGNPPAPGTVASNLVTKGFISVGMSAQSEAGDDITQKNANGELCVSTKSRDQFKRWDLTITFCEVNPSLLEMIAHAVVEEDWEGNVVGIRIPEGSSPDSFALELWTGVPGNDCAPGVATAYGYLLLPFVEPGVIGDITIENGAATFSVTGATRGAGGWGVGPYDVVPSDALNTPGPLTVAMANDEHSLLRTTTIAPPEADCDPQAMPAAA